MQKFTPETVLELYSSICDDGSWSSEAGHPFGEESQGGGLSGEVGDGNGPCPPGEAGNSAKQVCVAT